MNCESARDLLFADQENLLTARERAGLRAHLALCPDCRAEEAALKETYAALAGGLREVTASITPSAAFWTGLSDGLDAVDARRGRAAQPLRVGAWLHRQSRRKARRWVGATALLAALLASLLLGGGLQQAWADLRHRLYFVPVLGVGQVEETARVAQVPVSAGAGSLTVTVTSLVAGRNATLLAYTLSGPTLTALGPNLPVADAVDVALIGAGGRRYVPIYWVPTDQAQARGGVTVRGGIAFTPVLPGERTLRLEVTRLPLLAPLRHPISLTLTLKPVGAGAAQTSIPLNSSALHRGIRLTVTDLTFTGQAAVVDMASTIEDGPYAGGTVISLTPEQAAGDLAPALTGVPGAIQGALRPTLPAPVRTALLSHPEFVFGPVAGDRTTLRLVVPAVQVQLPGRAVIVVDAAGSTTQHVRLGNLDLTVHGRVVHPPAGLGLGDERRLRLSVAFPPEQAAGAPQRIALVVDGVGRTVSRDAPSVDLPLLTGQRILQVTLENPVVAIQGPWIIGLRQ